MFSCACHAASHLSPLASGSCSSQVQVLAATRTSPTHMFSVLQVSAPYLIINSLCCQHSVPLSLKLDSFLLFYLGVGTSYATLFNLQHSSKSFKKPEHLGVLWIPSSPKQKLWLCTTTIALWHLLYNSRLRTLLYCTYSPCFFLICSLLVV